MQASEYNTVQSSNFKWIQWSLVFKSHLFYCVLWFIFFFCLDNFYYPVSFFRKGLQIQRLKVLLYLKRTIYHCSSPACFSSEVCQHCSSISWHWILCLSSVTSSSFSCWVNIILIILLLLWLLLVLFSKARIMDSILSEFFNIWE